MSWTVRSISQRLVPALHRDRKVRYLGNLNSVCTHLVTAVQDLLFQLHRDHADRKHKAE